MPTKLTAVLLLFTAAASPGVPRTVSAAAPTVLPDNIIVHHTPYFENTAKAIPPSRRRPGGRIIVVGGQPRASARLLVRPIVDRAGSFDLAAKTEEHPFPFGPSQAPGTDNQIVRLKDGSLVAARDSYIWDEFTGDGPAWRDEIVTGSGLHKGQRAGVVLFRSTDGGDHWVRHGAVDMGLFERGRYGVPRPMDTSGRADVAPDQQGRNPDGSLRWWVGGPDRTELYSCPFTGSLYLTTRVISGPYRDLCPKLDRLLLLRSRDTGRTWELIRDDLPSWSPMVMTSTPNGRLFLLQCIGSQPTVYFSTNTPRGREKPTISPGYPVYFTEDGKPVAAAGGRDVDLFFQIGHPTISRLSTDRATSAVRVAYQSCGPSNTQEARVISVEARDPSGAPAVGNIATIRAEDPGSYSVMYFAFIDPDYVDMPRRVASDTSVLYWLETPKKDLPGRRWSARYALFSRDTVVGEPGFLSVSRGRPRLWDRRQDLGDYMTGGFFWWRDTLHYVAQWVEPDGIKANIVSVPCAPIRRAQ